MPRPNYITNEDIARWSETIDTDPFISEGIASNPIIREVCYAGQWLADRLTEVECPDHLIGRMMTTAARRCFGRKDFWLIHQEILDQFIAGTLEFEMDPAELN
jgi:hypothetical protein